MEIKKDRILPIDMARGISILMVIVVHTLWMYGDKTTQSETWLGTLIHFIGKGTGMFLIAMGFSFTFSRNQSVLLSIKRGVFVLLTGYLMNFLKFIVPTVLGFMPDNFIKAYGWTPPATMDNMLYMFATGDILQMAGVSLLFIGIINQFSKSKYVPLIMAILIVLSSKWVHGFRIGIPSVDYVFDLLWGAQWNVYFAVFPWAAFILVGMFFGKWYKEIKDIPFLFKRMASIGIILLVLGGGLCYYDFEYHFNDFFHLGPGGAIYLCGFNLILMWFAYFLVTTFKHNKVFDFIYYCSKRVTTIYVIQWTLICWGMVFLGYQELNVGNLLLLIPVFILISLLIQKLIDYLKAYKRNKKQVNSKMSLT